jgi:4-hydroxy-3-polyprenylbenzoate decarboxylase
MVQCKTINEKAIAHAEIVIEGELLPNVRLREDQNTNTGKAMPEFPGYTGEAKNALPVIKVKAVTHRYNPIWRTTVGLAKNTSTWRASRPKPASWIWSAAQCRANY